MITGGFISELIRISGTSRFIIYPRFCLVRDYFVWSKLECTLWPCRILCFPILLRLILVPSMNTKTFRTGLVNVLITLDPLNQTYYSHFKRCVVIYSNCKRGKWADYKHFDTSEKEKPKNFFTFNFFLAKCQFHQHFTCAFFARKIIA